ncbi:MAG: NUDIX hydrolase [Acidobacteria bacterium]|nr:NUDIX hydrolase [Acidobacteriota bacterium]
MKSAPMSAALLLIAATASAQELPEGYWGVDRSQPILDATRTIRLDPDLSDLTPGERRAVGHLLEAGAILHQLYLEAKHPEALSSLAALRALHVELDSRATRNLLALYRLSKGPIVTTLENERVAFLPVGPEKPVRNIYPPDATREAIDAYLARHPEMRDEILAERTIVRASSDTNLRHDIGTLARYPVLHVLHPGLAVHLRHVDANPEEHPFYAIPQSVAWAPEIMKIYELLNQAADAVEEDDAEFARYLRNRSRDLLSDDYESGDASWVTGRFGRLNAQIGSYETYDDPLYGAKAFMSLSLLKRDEEASTKLKSAIAGIQEIESSLPYERQKRVRDDIPVGVYEVIADFGQARGANTATILPNDPLFSQRYGRTILLRENIMRNPTLFENTKAGWDAVVAPAHRDDLTPNANFDRTLWHEIGHYLGVDRDVRGRTLDVALGATADSFEEMKADLVSLFAGPALRTAGYYDDAGLRSLYASGILRTLQTVKPRRDQPYQTMQLMQFNWFLDTGVLQFDSQTDRLAIDYSAYHDAVASLLEEVLEIQSAGDPAKAEAFVDRWTGWSNLHERIAKARRESLRFRNVIVRYDAVDGDATAP